MPDINRCLFWDCETRSCVDLRKTGAYVYATDPSTSVTLARLAIGKEPPVEWRPGEPLPDKYRKAFLDPLFEIVAHNAGGFERLMLTHILHPRHGWPEVSLDRWTCTMARVRTQGLPGSLDSAAMALGLDVRKDGAGHALMMRMCKPRGYLPNGDPTWWEDEERLQRLSDYCCWDVKVERAVWQTTQPVPLDEAEVWDQTEIMNDRGMRFDMSFVAAARKVGEDTRVLLDDEMHRLTDGAVPKASNVSALKKWLLARGVDLSPPPGLLPPPKPGPVAAVLDAPRLEMAEAEAEEVEGETIDEIDEEETKIPDLRRRDVIRLIADPRVGHLERLVLECRLEAGKISTKKLDAIAHRADADGVVRGLLGYHGASTGRYISTGLQIQNFPRDTVSDWNAYRRLLDDGAEMVDTLSMWPPLETISRMLRGSIIPRPGHEIASGDFSSVEAVGVAWLAGQDNLLNSFHRKDKVYEMMAANVYRRPAGSITSDSPERFVGKTLILGCGYGMGWRKFKETCLLQGRLTLSDALAETAVNTYRETFGSIPKLWDAMLNAAIRAVKKPGTVEKICDSRIRFRFDRSWLKMRLPSGRYLWYSRPLVEPGRFGNDVITYMGVNQKTKKWERIGTYGGRLTENAVQGLCRDLLVHATAKLEAAGYRPLTLVHDEIIAEPPIGHGSIEEMCALMSEVPKWAEGFALSAKGARGERYQKS